MRARADLDYRDVLCGEPSGALHRREVALVVERLVAGLERLVAVRHLVIRGVSARTTPARVGQSNGYPQVGSSKAGTRESSSAARKDSCRVGRTQSSDLGPREIEEAERIVRVGDRRSAQADARASGCEDDEVEKDEWSSGEGSGATMPVVAVLRTRAERRGPEVVRILRQRPVPVEPTNEALGQRLRARHELRRQHGVVLGADRANGVHLRTARHTLTIATPSCFARCARAVYSRFMMRHDPRVKRPRVADGDRTRRG